ncbi:hypothetical protein GCM10010185_54930 [Saccharothrix coeruleofusca]|uniref:Uncharacterized protein n=1 Tax=Saccharothrix coeruleofusca TaxID=33919 RepID=A0A918ARM9_9PSEU|nr:hypothetical protein GCM10010185_54930 [Saccharothrix coeruleofusca]
MPLDQRLRGPAHHRHVDGSGEVDHDLACVEVGALTSEPVVEQQAFLQRRERKDVLDHSGLSAHRNSDLW